MIVILRGAVFLLVLVLASLPAAAQLSVGCCTPVTNTGQVTTAGPAAVFSSDGGTLINLGALTSTGGTAVTSNNARIEDVTLVNSGAINGSVLLTNGGSNFKIINNAGATISSAVIVSAGTTGLSITNNGTISGGISMTRGGTLINSGVIINGSGPTVSIRDEPPGGPLTNPPTIVNNSGVIQSRSPLVGTAALQVIWAANITNSGTLQGDVGLRLAYPIVAPGVLWTVTNTGQIIGGSAAIEVSPSIGAMALTTSGTIRGNINMGFGPDTVTIKGGSITGDIVGRSVDGQAVTFDLGSNSVTFNGTIQNVPAINFQSGAFTLQPGMLSGGVSTVSIASQAALTLNVDLPSNVTNAGRLVIGANRMIAGSYAQTGTLGVTVGAASGNLLTVTGAATLTSPKIEVATPTDRLVRRGETFAILTANGGLTMVGTPTVTSLSNALTFTVSQTGNTESVTAVVDSTTSPLAQVRNIAGPASGVAGAVLSILNGNFALSDDLSRALATLTTLSGAQLQSAMTSLAPNTGNTVGTTAGTMSVTSGGNGTVSTRLQQTRAPGGDPLPSEGLQYWAQGFGGTLRQGVRDSFAGFSADSYGMMLGGDRAVGDVLRLGLAAGIARTEVASDSSRLGDAATVNGYLMNVYASYSPGLYYLDGMVMAGVNDNGTTRQIGMFGLTAKGSFDSYQTGVRVNAGMPVPVAGFTITPNVFTQYTFLDRDGYAETRAGGLGLRVRSQDTYAAELGVGVRVAYPVQVDRGTAVPEIRLNYIREVGDDRVPLTAAFLGGGPAFTTSGPSIPRDNFNLGAGATFYEMRDLSVSVNYDYLTNDASTAHTGTVRLRAAF